MTDYSIEGVRLLFPQGGVKTGHSNPNPGAMTMSEQETNWNITPGEKAQVKVWWVWFGAPANCPCTTLIILLISARVFGGH